MSAEEDMEINLLTRIAEVFRSEIERADRQTWEPGFIYFPDGSCGAVSEMLGHYLAEKWEVESIWVGSEHKEGINSRGSHAWLKVGSSIVDITGDQFACNSRPPVYVGPETPWYAQWVGRNEQNVRNRIAQESSAAFMAWGNAYNALCETGDIQSLLI